MRDIRLAAWLVRSVALRSPGAAPSALLAVGMAALVLLGLTSVSAREVAAHQHERATDIAVLVDPAQSTGGAGDLRIIDPGTTNARRWDGYEIRREYYDSGGSPLVAPGVPAMPGPGEFYASPDLVELISSNPVVAALFTSERLVGEISPKGLVQPHELRAILGVDGDRNLLTKVDGFGGTPPPANKAESDTQRVLDLSVAAYVLALVWIPAAFFLLIISRLAASRRQRRAGALHLIGYPKWRIHLLHFVEAACICVPSTVIACLIHWALTRSATTLTGTTFGFFSSDARLSLTTYLVVGALLLLVVCFAVSSDRRRGLRVRRAPHHQQRPNSLPRLGTAALAVGFVLLALPSAVSLDGGLTPLALWAGIVLSAVGVAIAGPALVTRVLAMRIERATASALVGRRMASHRVTTALRLASVMSVIIVLLLGSQSFASLLNGGSAQDWSQRAEAQGRVPVVATDLSGALTLDEISSVDILGGATQLRSVRTDNAFVNVVFSSCERLHVLIGHTNARNCPGTNSPRWLGKAPSADPGRTVDQLTLSSGQTLSVPPTTATLDVPGMPRAFAGALLLPSDLAPDTPQADGATFFLLAPSPDVSRVLASLSSLEPTLQFDLGALDRHNPETQEYPAQMEWLDVGAVVSLLIGFLSLLVVSLGEAQERSPRMRAMRVLGASRSQLFKIHFWCVTVPLVLVGLAAIMVGWLAAQAMRNIDDRADIDPAFYAVLAFAVVLGGLVVCLVSWRSVTRPSQRAGSFGA